MQGRVWILVLLAAILAGCAPAEEKKFTFRGEAQGTYYAVTYFDTRERNLQPKVDSILKAFDRSLSLWVPESILSRVNRRDSLAEPDEWFREIFRRSFDIAESTGGAFDFTVGPLVNAWGFGFKGKLTMDSNRVDSLRALVNYRNVSLGPGQQVTMPDGYRLDFNAIAQGYAVDVLGRFLQSQGIGRYLVDIGGEVLGRGVKPDGAPWIVGIENPAADSLSERTLNSRVKLADKALATSGSYRKYREENGMRYSHTIDPTTGYPVTHNLLSVSVLAADCATADGYATAFMVMGMEKSLKFLESHTGLEAFFIYSGEGGVYLTKATEGFRGILIE
jgi:thiamine biosynthesis lipoprotein